jgi:hypothetical protein
MEQSKVNWEQQYKYSTDATDLEAASTPAPVEFPISQQQKPMLNLHIQHP